MSQVFNPNFTRIKAFHEDYFLDNSQRDILNDSNAENAEKARTIVESMNTQMI